LDKEAQDLPKTDNTVPDYMIDLKTIYNIHHIRSNENHFQFSKTWGIIVPPDITGPYHCLFKKEHQILIDHKYQQKSCNHQIPIKSAFCLLLLSLLFLSIPVFSQSSLEYFKASRSLENEERVCRLARRAVEERLTADREIKPPNDLPKFMKRPSGVFVTIIKGKKVVGCMGTIHPGEKNLAHEIIRSSILAATADPWHSPISVGELPDLKYIISIPGNMKRVRSSAELNPATLGLLVRRGNRSALLLPGEALTAEWQIYECKRKAGIPQNERVDMFVFETVVFGPG